jgi:hypothetical protein
MHSRLLLYYAIALCGASPGALAQTIAAWDFEDQDLVVDVTSVGNTDNAITVTGNIASTWPAGETGGRALGLTSMATQEVSHFLIPFDATDRADVRVSFSTRASNTAPKWWRVEVSLGGADFAPVLPLVEQSGGQWVRVSRDLPAADEQGDVRVRVVATDSNGDGTGAWQGADGTSTPAGGGTFRVDNVLVQSVVPGVDAGPDPADAGLPNDAGAPPDDGGPLPPAPIITEVAWMGTAASGLDEWVEIYNASNEAIPDLSRYVLVENNGPRALPAVPLAVGQVLVLQRPGSLSLTPPEAIDIQLALADGTTEFLRSCPADAQSELELCDVASVAGVAWPAGHATQKRTMVRRHHDLDGRLTSSWATYSGGASAVTDRSGTGVLGSPGEYEPITNSPDGGPLHTDGGFVVPVVDAGPNEPPKLSLTHPSGQVQGSEPVTVRYAAHDPDGDDTVSVSLFYDDDAVGYDGVRFARGLPAGESAFAWTPQGVPAGTYHVFGVAEDVRGERAFSYAPGTVVIPSAGPNGGASLRVTNPNGVNDVTSRGIPILWEAELPSGANGVVSLWFDVDGEGLDGQPIIAGLPVSMDDGEPGPRAFLWDPVGVPPGTYAIYAVLDWTGGTLSDYSEFFSVDEAGCGCRSTTQGEGELVAYGLSLLALLSFARRRAAKRHDRASA